MSEVAKRVTPLGWGRRGTSQKFAKSTLNAHAFTHQDFLIDIRVAVTMSGWNSALTGYEPSGSFRLAPSAKDRPGLVLPHIRVYQKWWTMPVKDGGDVLAGKSRHL